MRPPYLLIGLLFAFWVALTGSLSPIELGTGLAASVLVGLAAVRILGDEAPELSVTPREMARFLLYVPYLLKQVVLASLDVAETVLDPRLPISPVVVECSYPMSREVASVVLANSITLTPGTLTIDTTQDVFHLHCLAEEFADGLMESDLYHRVMDVFGGEE